MAKGLSVVRAVVTAAHGRTRTYEYIRVHIRTRTYVRVDQKMIEGWLNHYLAENECAGFN